MEKRYVSLGGYATVLSGKLPRKDRFLPLSKVDTDNLLDVLEWGDYTHLALLDGNVTEVVRVENYCGRLLLSRGMSGTKALSFRCGTCVEFIVTPEGVQDMVCQGYSCQALLDLPCENCEGA